MTTHRRILILAYPNQGHINPSLQLAKRLRAMGAAVTFSTTRSAVRRITKTTTHGLTFAPFSDGHDDDEQTNTTTAQSVADVGATGPPALAQTLAAAAAVGHPFDHLVYTIIVPWAGHVAETHNVKSTLLWCQAATVFDIYYYYFHGYGDHISTNNNDPSFSVDLPGLPPAAMADLPSFFSPSSPREHDFALKILKHHFDVLEKSPKVLVNTFEDLESGPIKAVENLELVPVGPLIPSAFLDGKDPSDKSFGGDLIEESSDADRDYITWLNTQPDSSVVYVSFGTQSTFSPEQAAEMALGLAETRRPFLWVMRQGLGEGETEELKKQGMVVRWCSQVEVLSHRAVGCFLTHCGWNSTVEAVVAGVPMVGFPQWTDQTTNGKMIEDVWGVGVRVRRSGDGVVGGGEIKRCVEVVMGGGERAVEVRRNAKKWRELAMAAVNEGGSSTINLQAFLNSVAN